MQAPSPPSSSSRLRLLPEAALVATFLGMAAYEGAEVLLLEAPTGPGVSLTILLHSLQVLAILAGAWALLRALRQRAAHQEALARMVEKVLFAQEQERRRVAYELHDAVSPLVVSAKQHAETCRDSWSDDDARARAELDRGIERLRQAIVETRRLLRALRPTDVDAEGLAAAVRRVLDEAAEEADWTVAFEHDLGELRLPSAVEMAAFRVAQEALRNAAKHARAGRVEVRLQRAGDALRLKVRDDGVGFSAGEVPSRGLGLASMRERAELLGGSCHIESARSQGTTVEVSLPLRTEGP